ncbi:MAG TPA: hypothetical protein VKS60_17515 [Stellaceae bacterium]|nr:hypothetical protein [Stellaceae bacterium]
MASDGLAVSIAAIRGLVRRGRSAEARRAIAETMAALRAAPAETFDRGGYEALAELCMAVVEMTAAAELLKAVEQRCGSDRILTLQIIEALAQSAPNQAVEMIAPLMKTIELSAETLPHLVRIHAALVRREHKVRYPGLVRRTRALEDRWIAVDPGNPAAYLEAARCSLWRKDEARARRLLTRAGGRAAARSSEDFWHLAHLHDLQLQQGLADAAAQSATLCLNLDPEHPAAWTRVMAAQTAGIRNALPVAELDALAEKILARDSKDADYWLGAANALARAGRIEAARAAIARCLEIDPQNTLARQVQLGLTSGFTGSPPGTVATRNRSPWHRLLATMRSRPKAT